MGAVADKKPDYKVIPTPKRSWLGRWWLWFFVGAFVSVFTCYQWNRYRNEKFNRYLLELGQQGINVEVKSVQEHSWVLSHGEYVPSFIDELLATPKTSITFTGNEIREDSLLCLDKLPNITSMTFKDTPNLNDTSLARLSDLQSLTRLDLTNTSISAMGLVHLQKLPNLVINITPKNSLTNDEMDQLLVMKPTIYVYDAKAESVKPGSMEMININGSSSVKVGDFVVFRGSFTSTHCIPYETLVTYDRLVDRTDPFGSESWQNVQGASSFEFSKGANGTYQFLSRQMDLNKAGRYRAEIKFAVRNQTGNQLSSSIWFKLGVKEFEVKEKSTTPPEKLNFKPKVSLQWPGQPHEGNIFLPTLDGDYKIYNATLTDEQPAMVNIYLLNVTEHPVKALKEMTTKGLLDASVSAFKEHETSRKEIEFGPKKYPGLDITSFSGKQYSRTIVIMAGPRRYTISVASNDEQALKSEKANAFFQSFAITNDE